MTTATVFLNTTFVWSSFEIHSNEFLFVLILKLICNLVRHDNDDIMIYECCAVTKVLHSCVWQLTKVV